MPNHRGTRLVRTTVTYPSPQNAIVRLLIPAWQKTYADALLETNPNKVPSLVLKARREIVAHYIERAGSVLSDDEFLDLSNATKILEQIEALPLAAG